MIQDEGCKEFFFPEITPPSPSYIPDTGTYLPVILHKAAMFPIPGVAVFCIHPSIRKNNHHGYQTHRQLQQTPRAAGIFLPPVRSLHRNGNQQHIRAVTEDGTTLRFPSDCR
jgi:hypothetical protein